MHRTVLRLMLVLGGALSLAASADTALIIDAPYVRLAPPGVQATGAFMVIKNTGSIDRKLVNAESTAAKMVQLHNHINEDGVMKMREVKSIDIKANSQAELKPGGYHVMMIDMTKELKEGDVVPITLGFDDGSKVQVEAPVLRSPDAMRDNKMMDHGKTLH